MTPIPEKPKRRVEFSLHLMADSEAECSRMLEQIAFEFDQSKLQGHFVSGGVSSGFWGETIIRPEITPKRYQEALAAYLATIDAHKEKQS